MKQQKIVENFEPDFIFHLAAQAIVSKSYDNPLDTFKTNIIGTANILGIIDKLLKKCIAVIITSDKCYENQAAGIGHTVKMTPWAAKTHTALLQRPVLN